MKPTKTKRERNPTLVKPTKTERERETQTPPPHRRARPPPPWACVSLSSHLFQIRFYGFVVLDPLVLLVCDLRFVGL